MTAGAAPAAFSADWLQQREPFDRAARDAAAARLRLPAWLASIRPAQGPWRVIDLGCGTGANLRWLAPRLIQAQQWLLVDQDPALLARLHTGAAQVERLTLRLDLAHDLETLPVADCTLVTCSALLDLVGEPWLQRLVRTCAVARVPVLWALSVDGRQAWTPADPADGLAQRLFAAHQRRDKGFGPALGAHAPAVAARTLRAAGYRVCSARSDWLIDARGDAAAAALQRVLIDGIAVAAIEQSPRDAAALNDWRARRQALAAHSRLTIGHIDLAAAPR